MGSVLKHCKVPKCHDQDCLKILFLLFTVPVLIEISGRNAYLAQKFCSGKNLSISKGESFLESIFDLNQICKILSTQNH